jgi:DNA excision repair protein ERCC-3
VVSKVANFSVDLPEATVPCRCRARSGRGRRRRSGSGRLLRPKGDGPAGAFYSVVSRDTVDTEYAAHRQRFLAEQGYAYRSSTPTTCSGRRCRRPA